jgi:putative flavoprotein involved in K+ transport
MSRAAEERIDTVVVGGGQAGLAVGYHLAKQGVPFVILDANERVGDSWRRRWDSLRLFTPARFDGLPGMPFPERPHVFPTKDQMGDYLEAYAERFTLPVRTGVRVERLSRNGEGFLLEAGDRRFHAARVVVAMANYQRPRTPPWGAELDPGIVQLHSARYRNPSQLQDGPVLIVGAGNSGSEIAMELSRTHRIWMSGRDNGYIPFRIEGRPARLFLLKLVLRFVFHHIMTVDTPVGREARPKMVSRGGPLIRVKPKTLAAAGVTLVPKTRGIRNGLPELEDGRVLEVANVVWCTGFEPGFSWIDLPIGSGHEPRHRRGLVDDCPGLYFVGLHFLTALSSAMIHGVGRDAARVAGIIASRARRDARAA